MKRTYVFLLLAGVAIGGLTTGYWLGLRQGADFGVMFVTALRGWHSLDSLWAIQNGKSKSYALGLESDVDEALIQNYYLEAHPAFRFMPAVWGAGIESARRESLAKVAAYRKEHPSPFSRDALEASGVLTKLDPENRQTVAKIQGIIAEMVDRYSVKTSKDP